MDGLTVRDVSVDYGGFEGWKTVLHAVSCSVRPGEVLGVLGESGSGKSVLGKAILGLLEPSAKVTSGEIVFAGQDLLRLDEKRWDKLRGTEVAFLVSNPRARLNPLMGVGKQVENVVRGASPKVSEDDARERVIEMLAQVGIPAAVRRYGALPHEFSGGMCQRVVIAMSLVNEPALVIADEPTSGLDVTVQRQILDLMRRLVENRGTSVVIMTRDPGVVAHYTERTIVMRAGAIVDGGETTGFFRGPTTEYSKELLRRAVAATRGTMSA